MPRIASHMTVFARELRNTMTTEERLVWLRLRGCSPRFTRQLPVGRYIIDLACRSAKVAVEIDGSQHVEAPKDAERTAFLERLGWQVLRFANTEVRENADGVAEVILAEVGKRVGPTHPQPLPSREGRQRRPRSRASSTS